MSRRGFLSSLFLCAGGAILLVTVLVLSAARRTEPQSHWLVIRKWEEDRVNFYRMHPNGSDLRKIDHLPPNFIEINWSPDGRWIAYLGLDENKVTQLYRMRPGGSHQEQLTFNPNNINTLEWSPDSQQIIYSTFN